MFRIKLFIRNEAAPQQKEIFKQKLNLNTILLRLLGETSQGKRRYAPKLFSRKYYKAMFESNDFHVFNYHNVTHNLLRNEDEASQLSERPPRTRLLFLEISSLLCCISFVLFDILRHEKYCSFCVQFVPGPF